MIKKVKIPEHMKHSVYDWGNVVEEIEEAVEDTSMIRWVGSADGHYAMKWPDFRSYFVDTDYRLTGGQNVLASDLVVVLDDGSWYEQDPTNGCWYQRWPPMLQPGYKSFENVTTGQPDTPITGNCSLAELNEAND